MGNGHAAPRRRHPVEEEGEVAEEEVPMCIHTPAFFTALQWRNYFLGYVAKVDKRYNDASSLGPASSKQNICARTRYTCSRR